MSALDGYVGEAVYNEVIRGLIKDKTVVLVANDKSLLKKFDKIYEFTYESGNEVLDASNDEFNFDHPLGEEIELVEFKKRVFPTLR